MIDFKKRMSSLRKLYLWTLLVLVLFMLVSSSNAKKMKSKFLRNPKRIIKGYHRMFSKKVEGAKSFEEFVRVFENGEDFTATMQGILNESLHEQPVPIDGGQVRQLQELTALDDQAALTKIKEQDAAVACRQPVPLLLDAYEVLGMSKGYLQYIWPKCLSVSRCGAHSGCCDEPKKCSVKPGNTRNGTRLVFIKTVIPGDEFAGSFSYHEVDIVEDTLCECRLPDNYLKCKISRCPSGKTKNARICQCECIKRCPQFFKQDPDNCQCYCSTNPDYSSRHCWKMYRAKTKLPTSECRCIRDGLCNVPDCKRGYLFNETVCSCTRQFEIGLQSTTPSSVQKANFNPSFLDKLFFTGEMAVRASKRHHETHVNDSEPSMHNARGMPENLPINNFVEKGETSLSVQKVPSNHLAKATKPSERSNNTTAGERLSASNPTRTETLHIQTKERLYNQPDTFRTNDRGTSMIQPLTTNQNLSPKDDVVRNRLAFHKISHMLDEIGDSYDWSSSDTDDSEIKSDGQGYVFIKQGLKPEDREFYGSRVQAEINGDLNSRSEIEGSGDDLLNGLP